MQTWKQTCFAAALTLSVFLAFSPLAPLLAQESPAPITVEAASTPSPTQPSAVETVVVNQDVSIPYGQYVEDVGQLVQAWLIPLLLAIISWVIFKYVPAPLRGIANRILTGQAEQLLEKALQYGINATAGASRDKTLEIPVANEVLRKAANYALANGWPKLIDFLDGPDGVLQKLFTRLDIPVEATNKTLNVPEIKVPEVKAKAIIADQKKAGGGVVMPNWVMLK